MDAKFGSRVKELRISKKLSLRQFCIKTDLDASNWSKIERGLMPPPTDLSRIASTLELDQGSEAMKELMDLAALDKGIIPKEVMDNEELMAALPIFFRTARGDKPSREELQQLLDVIKKVNQRQD